VRNATYNLDPRAPHSPTPPTGRSSMVQGDDGGQRAEKITETPYFRLEAVSNACLNFSRPFEKRPIVAGSFQPTLFLPGEPQAHKPPALGVSLFRDKAAQAGDSHGPHINEFLVVWNTATLGLVARAAADDRQGAFDATNGQKLARLSALPR